MADIQADIAGASQDLQTIEDFVNLPAGSDVRPRLLPSVNVGTLAGTRQAIFEAGGLPAVPKKTFADLSGSGLTEGAYAVVTDDPIVSKNGLYVISGGAWVKSKYDPVGMSKAILDGSKILKPAYMPTSTTNVDTLLEQGFYMPHSDAAAKGFGLPSNIAGVLFVTGEYYPQQVTQIYTTRLGIYIRNKPTSSGVWTAWGTSFDGSPINWSTETDNLVNTGINASAYNGAAPSNVKVPFVDDDRFMLVTGRSSSVRQLYASASGIAFRTSNSANIWGAWSGIKTKKTGFHDLEKLENDINDLSANSGFASKVIYGWGSSTLELADSYFTTMAERHSHVYIGHGVSGETLAVSGMQQGSNIVTLKFADATLTNNTNHAVTITQSFKPKRGRSYKEVELSNGVKGLLYFSENTTNANTFKPTNLTAPLPVDTTYEYRAINPQFINQGKGLYYFDIGKNNMGYADTAQDIVDAQQEMIDYIPEGSEYLVGGHFVNVGLAGTDYGNKVVAVNQMLKLRYGLRFCDYYDFLYDDTIWTKYGITKTAEDIAAIAAGELPPSLGRDIGTGTRDTAHLRDEMSAEIALQAEARFIKLGYFS